MILDDIIDILNNNDVSQDVIDSIYNVIINNEEDELEHFILNSFGIFEEYNSNKFISHRI